jgi:hypothetical protein
MTKKTSRERALAASFRQITRQQRVSIPLAELPSRTVEETLEERDYVLVCHGARTLAVYRVQPDGVHRLKRWPKALTLRL